MSNTTDRRIISHEFALALAARKQSDGVDFFSDDFKSIREWIVLGNACDLMKKEGLPAPYFAEKAERPDFTVFAANGEKIGGVEIAEAMRPGYRRHKFFKDDFHSDSMEPYPMDPPLADPWQTLRTTIVKKANKQYPSDTALLVYLNISLLYFENWKPEVLYQLIEEHSRTPFECVDHFREVLVLDSGMSGLARLHPQPEVLLPSANPFNDCSEALSTIENPRSSVEFSAPPPAPC